MANMSSRYFSPSMYKTPAMENRIKIKTYCEDMKLSRMLARKKKMDGLTPGRPNKEKHYDYDVLHRKKQQDMTCNNYDTLGKDWQRNLRMEIPVLKFSRKTELPCDQGAGGSKAFSRSNKERHYDHDILQRKNQQKVAYNSYRYDILEKDRQQNLTMEETAFKFSGNTIYQSDQGYSKAFKETWVPTHRRKFDDSNFKLQTPASVHLTPDPKRNVFSPTQTPFWGKYPVKYFPHYETGNLVDSLQDPFLPTNKSDDDYSGNQNYRHQMLVDRQNKSVVYFYRRSKDICKTI